MEDNLKDQMTEAHEALLTSVKAKEFALENLKTEGEAQPVHQAFAQTEDMFEGTPVYV
jgi:hypothetical protein